MTTLWRASCGFEAKAAEVMTSLSRRRWLVGAIGGVDDEGVVPEVCLLTRNTLHSLVVRVFVRVVPYLESGRCEGGRELW